MNRKKTGVGTLLLVLMLSLLLQGCGSKKKAEIWKGERISFAGYDMTMEEYKDLYNGENSECTIELRDGGVFSMNMLGAEGEGTWTQEGSKVTLTIDDASVYGTLEEDKFTIDFGGMIIELTK